jgi:hypothetical protein
MLWTPMSWGHPHSATKLAHRDLNCPPQRNSLGSCTPQPRTLLLHNYSDPSPAYWARLA